MPGPTLVMGTHNRDKGVEITAHLDGLTLNLRGLWEWADMDPVDETGDTLVANAILKADAAARHTGCWAMADDTGLEVDYLDGAPGVYSARYAGPEARYEDNCIKLIRALESVPDDERAARFRAVIALARPGAPTETVEGVVDGVILSAPRGAGGFGYDPVFFYPPTAKSFAEMSLTEKNRVSHRGLALDRLAQRLQELLG
jgi:XTP/dITP diphosphohydrolase